MPVFPASVENPHHVQLQPEKILVPFRRFSHVHVDLVVHVPVDLCGQIYWLGGSNSSSRYFNNRVCLRLVPGLDCTVRSTSNNYE